MEFGFYDAVYIYECFVLVICSRGTDCPDPVPKFVIQFQIRLMSTPFSAIVHIKCHQSFALICIIISFRHSLLLRHF